MFVDYRRIGDMLLKIMMWEMKMLTQEQINVLTDMFGLEWIDYVEEVEDE